MNKLTLVGAMGGVNNLSKHGGKEKIYIKKDILALIFWYGLYEHDAQKTMHFLGIDRHVLRSKKFNDKKGNKILLQNILEY